MWLWLGMRRVGGVGGGGTQFGKDCIKKNTDPLGSVFCCFVNAKLNAELSIHHINVIPAMARDLFEIQ